MTMAIAPTAVHQIESASEMKQALAVVKSALAPDLTDAELTLFALVAQRSGLDPFARQIHAVKRKGRVTFQTGIDGLRSGAERTGEFVNSDEPVYSAPCPCGKDPKGHPEWATVIVHRRRDGAIVDQAATAYWHEYVPDAGQDFQWKKMPRLMLGKCAEALALRKAFPYVLTDVYTPEEMAQEPADAPAPVKKSARERVAELAAATVQDEPSALAGEVIEDAIVEELIEPESDERQETPVGASDPEEAAEEPTPSGSAPFTQATCGDVAPEAGVSAGEICHLAAGHRGVHKNEAGSASWPQAK